MFSPFYEILKPQLLSLPPANEVWGKVIFLHLSVILFTGGGEVPGKVPRPPGRYTPWQLHPPAGTPPAGTPPWAGTPPPWASITPPGQVPPLPGRYALPQQCILAGFPLELENLEK